VPHGCTGKTVSWFAVYFRNDAREMDFEFLKMSINAHESEMILMIQSTSTNDVDKDCKGWFYQLTHHFLLE
jgi:hypothetical protein